MSVEVHQSEALFEPRGEAAADGADLLLREAQDGMLVLTTEQRQQAQQASLPAEFGELILVVNKDGTGLQVVRLETPAEKDKRLADEERERQAEEARRRAEEAERQAAEAQKRAQEAERRAEDAQRRASQAEAVAAEAVRHAEQAERRAQRALKEMQGMAHNIAALMQWASKPRTRAS